MYYIRYAKIFKLIEDSLAFEPKVIVEQGFLCANKTAVLKFKNFNLLGPLYVDQTWRLKTVQEHGFFGTCAEFGGYHVFRPNDVIGRYIMANANKDRRQKRRVIDSEKDEKAIELLQKLIDNTKK